MLSFFYPNSQQLQKLFYQYWNHTELNWNWTQDWHKSLQSMGHVLNLESMELSVYTSLVPGPTGLFHFFLQNPLKIIILPFQLKFFKKCIDYIV